MNAAVNAPVEQDERSHRRERSAFALAALSLACLVALSATHAPLADHWLTAVPFALLGWAGFASSLAGVVLGTGRLRALPTALAVVWIALWVLTFSAEAQDAVASMRRVAFAFIAF